MYDIVGQSTRRGIHKAIKSLTFCLVGGSDPLKELATDTTEELATKTIQRSHEKTNRF